MFLILISVAVGAANGRLTELVNAVFAACKTAVDISIYLIGIMAFWLGMVKIAEKAGLVNALAKLVAPIARFIFPSVSKDGEAMGLITLNFSANALGLSNAATPFGIKAMEELQKENQDKESASDSMCMLLAMNTAGFQLVPATVLAVLAANGYKNPAEIIVPTMVVTLIAFVSAILAARLFAFLYSKQGGNSA